MAHDSLLEHQPKAARGLKPLWPFVRAAAGSLARRESTEVQRNLVALRHGGLDSLHLPPAVDSADSHSGRRTRSQAVSWYTYEAAHVRQVRPLPRSSKLAWAAFFLNRAPLLAESRATLALAAARMPRMESRQSIKKIRFSIRDLLWLTLLAGVLTAWWIDRQNLFAKFEREKNPAYHYFEMKKQYDAALKKAAAEREANGK
jgi:hypothetical protein